MSRFFAEELAYLERLDPDDLSEAAQERLAGLRERRDEAAAWKRRDHGDAIRLGKKRSAARRALMAWMAERGDPDPEAVMKAVEAAGWAFDKFNVP